MKILVITQMYSEPDDVGDNKPTKTVNYFARDWHLLGHEVTVIHCSSKFLFFLYLIPDIIKERIAGKYSKIIPPLASMKKIQWDESGVNVYRLPMFKLFPGQAFSKKQMIQQAELIKSILKNKAFTPDLIVGHFANPSLELVANLSHFYKSMSSIVFHQDCNERTITKYRIKENCSKVAAIGTRSIIEAYKVKQLLELPVLPFVCFSGVPDEAVKNAANGCVKHVFNKGIKFLYVGSLINRKHVDVVIQAFMDISTDKDSLIIIGGGPEEDKLKRLAERFKDSQRIHFKGRIKREEVLKTMKEANIFTLISSDEVYGMVYIEAMLQGCLTIASKGEGFDGIIQDGINGFLCEPGNLTELKNIYKRIIAMTISKRNSIGQKAINLAIHYSESEVAKRYLNDIMKNQR